MSKGKKQEGLLKKAREWGPIIFAAWIGKNIILSYALLQIPSVRKSLIVLGNKLPFDIPGIG